MPAINDTQISGDGKSLRRPSLVVNAISNWGALGINMLVGFLLTPYIIRCLGTVQYGIWILIASVIGYYGLLDLGVSSAIMRYVARYAGQEDHESLNEVVNTALVIFSVIGCIIIIISILLAAPLAHFFNIENSDFASFKLVIWLLGISAGLALPGNVLFVIILAHERFVVANTIRIIVTLLRGGLFFCILYQGGGLVGMGWVSGGISIFMLVVHFAIVKTYFKHVNISLTVVNKTSARALFGFGFFAFIGKMGDLLRFKLDSLVIARYLNLELVGIYGLAAVLFGYLFRMCIASSGVTAPRLSALAGKNDKELFRQALMKYSVITSTMAAGMGLAAFLLGGDFIRLWVPDSFTDVHGATVVFLILVASLVPDLMTNVSINALQALKKHKYYAYQTIIEGLANLTLSLLLVKSYGIYGVALGTAIPVIATKLVIQPIYCSIILQIDWWKYMLDVIIKPLLVSIGIVILWHVSGNLAAETYFSLMFKGVVILSLYAIISYKFCFNKQIRQIVTDKVKHLCRHINTSLQGARKSC